MRVASSRSVRSEDSLNYGDRRVRQHDIRETDPHRCGRFGGVREFLMRTRDFVSRASVAVCFCPLRHSHRFASRLFSRALLATLHRARITPLAVPITVKLEIRFECVRHPGAIRQDRREEQVPSVSLRAFHHPEWQSLPVCVQFSDSSISTGCCITRVANAIVCVACGRGWRRGYEM